MNSIPATSSDLLAGMSASQIVQKLRKQWQSDPKKFAAIQKQATRIKMNDGRMKTFIRCAGCSGLFPRHLIHGHHLLQVGPLVSTLPADVEAYKQRLFVPAAGIRAYCEFCHQEISNLQRFKGKTNVIN